MSRISSRAMPRWLRPQGRKSCRAELKDRRQLVIIILECGGVWMFPARHFFGTRSRVERHSNLALPFAPRKSPVPSAGLQRGEKLQGLRWRRYLIASGIDVVVRYKAVSDDKCCGYTQMMILSLLRIEMVRESSSGAIPSKRFVLKDKRQSDNATSLIYVDILFIWIFYAAYETATGYRNYDT